MVSDQGGPSLAAVTQEMLDICEVHHINTPAHNPQCNSQTETLNKTLAVMPSFYVDDNQRNWDVHLPFVTSAYNTSKHASTGYTPFFLLYDRQCRSIMDADFGALPLETLKSLREYMKTLVERIWPAGKVARENILQIQTGYILSGNEKTHPTRTQDWRFGTVVHSSKKAWVIMETGVSLFWSKLSNQPCIQTYEILSIRAKVGEKIVMTVQVKRLRLFHELLTDEQIMNDFDSQ